MVQAFRFGGTTGPTDSGSAFAYDSGSNSYFATSASNADGTASASAGPFNVKAEMSKSSSFTWTPLSAELNVGSSFGLTISTALSVVPAGVAIEWVPALPANTALVAGAAAALVAAPALIVGIAGMASGESGKNEVEIASYLALVSAALALVAVQQNITMTLAFPLILTVDLQPLLVVKKNEGEAATFSALDTKTDVFQKEDNSANTAAALGIVEANGSSTDSNGGNVGANAQQNRVAGTDNSS